MYRPMVQWDHDRAQETIKKAQDCVGPSPLGYLYRFDWNPEYGNLMFTAYPIIKRTPRGWRVKTSGVYGTTRQICEDTRRKFAADTVAKALVSYQARKVRQRAILQARADDAQRAFEAADPEAFKIRREIDFLED